MFCYRWLRPELRSGLTVMEMHLPTGYTVVNDVLREYVQSGVVSNLGRAEFYDRKLVYYFDFVSILILIFFCDM